MTHLCMAAPIDGSNIDAYTASGIVDNPTEGPTGSFVCTMNITASRGQHFVVLRYQEGWVRHDPFYLSCERDFCKNTITVTLSGPGISNTETLSADGMTGPPNGTGPAWIPVLSIPQQIDSWERTVVRKVDVSAVTQSADAILQFTIADAVPQGSYQGSTDGTFLAGRSFTLVDPVPDLQNGNQIATDPETLVTLGTRVSGIAADGASRVVIRLFAQKPGQTVTLNLLNDQGQASSDASKDGTISSVGGMPSSGPLQLTAVTTNHGPYAFAIYQPPTDFSRGGADDNAPSRQVSIKWQFGTPAIVDSAPITIWRPPVVLVHGLWGSGEDWNNFKQFLTDSRFNDAQCGFCVRRAAYDFGIGGSISASTPAYSTSVLARTKANALGFDFNAPLVLDQITEAVVDFRTLRQAAATQADVVAHSMGGDITRTLENLPLFREYSSFGIGNVHKLITIGTPHLGTPLAGLLLNDNNSCVRNLLVFFGKVAISSATVAGIPNVGGAVGDLVGDGFGGGLSQALNTMWQPNGHEVKTALIAGIMNGNNTSSLGSSGAAMTVRGRCSSNFLAASLTAANWEQNVFGGARTDGIVPVPSQGQVSPDFQVAGVIHSSGVADLGFTGPGELDGYNSMFQTLVIQLLNTSIQAAPFVPLP